MDEPIEPAAAIDDAAERATPVPVGARSTEHPWEEPPLLPAPSMFLGPPTAPARGRHAGRRHPFALMSGAVAAAFLLGASAIALVDVAQNGPAGAGAGGIAQADGPAGSAEQGAASSGGSGSGPSAGTGHGLVSARSVHNAAAPLPSALSSTYSDAPIGAAFAGHSPTAGVPNRVVTAPTTSTSAGTGRSTPRGVVPASGGGPSSSSSRSSAPSVPRGAPSSGGVLPNPPRSSAVPSYVPAPPSTEPSAVPEPIPHSTPPVAQPVPSAPGSVPPVRTPTGHPVPPPVSVPAVPVPPSVPPTIEAPAGDSGLHKALGHATPAAGAALGHATSPAQPEATPTAHVPLLPGTQVDPLPTVSAAE